MNKKFIDYKGFRYYYDGNRHLITTILEVFSQEYQ